jgi:hypothetical protein
MITKLTEMTGLAPHQLIGVTLLCISCFCWGLAGRIPHTALWWVEVEPDAEPLGPVTGPLDRARNWLHQRNEARQAGREWDEALTEHELPADESWGDTLAAIPAVPAAPAWRPETGPQRAVRETMAHAEIPAPLPPQPAGPGAVDMGQLYRTEPAQPRFQSGVYAFQPDTATVITGVITDAGQAQRQPEPETQEVAVTRIVPPSIELDQSIQEKFARLMADSTAGPVTHRVRELIAAGP